MTSSELYYSDLVEKKLVLDLTKVNGTADKSVEYLNQFVSAISDQANQWEANQVKNVWVKMWAEQKDLVCCVSGSVPWSQEKIEAFHQEVSSKKKQDESSLELLSSLIEQHPDAALEILSTILKSK